MRRFVTPAVLLVCLALSAACGGKRGSGIVVPEGPGVEPPPPVEDEGAARFSGLGASIPTEDGAKLFWQPIDVDGDFAVQYEVFFTTDGSEPDFSDPQLVTDPGASGATIDGIASGSKLRAAVRAVEIGAARAASGRPDLNEVVLDTELLEILYVD